MENGVNGWNGHHAVYHVVKVLEEHIDIVIVQSQNTVELNVLETALKKNPAIMDHAQVRFKLT